MEDQSRQLYSCWPVARTRPSWCRGGRLIQVQLANNSAANQDDDPGIPRLEWPMLLLDSRQSGKYI